MGLMRKIGLVCGLVLAFATGFGAGAGICDVNVHASELPSGYTKLDYVEFDNSSGGKKTMEVPFKLSSSPTEYSWKLEISNLRKDNSSGSLVGFYNGNRTGYLYTNGDYTNSMVIAIGNGTYAGADTPVSLPIIDGNDNTPFTVTAEIGGNMFSVTAKTNQIIRNSWSGEMPTDDTAFLTGCAAGHNEFMSFKFYGVEVRDSAGNLMVHMIPAKDSGEVLGAYDTVTRNFYPVFNYGDIQLVVIDNQGGIGGRDGGLNFTNGQYATAVGNLNPTPHKEGYHFGGYYTKPNGKGTRYYDEEGNALKVRAAFSADNYTLYAYWISDQPSPKKSGESTSKFKPFRLNFGSVAEKKPAPVIVDRDTFKSEAPSRTVIASESTTANDFYDLKVHSVDEKTLKNQEFLVRSLIGPNAENILTEGIYPRRDLTMSENGLKRYLIWSNLPQNQAGPIYAVVYNQTDGAYVITGSLDENGTATFTDFRLRSASTITICK